jgi:hypothetical protein
VIGDWLFVFVIGGLLAAMIGPGAFIRRDR